MIATQTLVKRERRLLSVFVDTVVDSGEVERGFIVRVERLERNAVWWARFKTMRVIPA